jgi:hypothetical protein
MTKKILSVINISQKGGGIIEVAREYLVKRRSRKEHFRRCHLIYKLLKLQIFLDFHWIFLGSLWNDLHFLHTIFPLREHLSTVVFVFSAQISRQFFSYSGRYKGIFVSTLVKKVPPYCGRRVGGGGVAGWPPFLLWTALRKKRPLSGSRILWERGSSLAVVTSSPSCTGPG